MQKFAGYLASLNRFVSQLGEKAMSLYQLMKKTNHFDWSHRADDAFNNLDTLQMYLLFLMLHACLHQLLYILFTLHGIFMHFLELTY
jgi:hypothetical protein